MGAKEIKTRMRSISSTQQITRALQLVAGVKLRRAEEMARSLRPYGEKLMKMMQLLSQGNVTSPLFRPREGGRGLILVTSDMGLAGGYNSSLYRLMEKKGPWDGYIVVGRKGRDYLFNRGLPIFGEFMGMDDYPKFREGSRIGQLVQGLFAQGVFGQVYFCYNFFVSKMEQRPVITKLMPLIPEEGSRSQEYIFEPSASEVLEALGKEYVEATIYGALLESKASEHSARMRAMNVATDNADDLMDELTLHLNRIRQGQITAEIAEIAGARGNL